MALYCLGRRAAGDGRRECWGSAPVTQALPQPARL